MSRKCCTKTTQYERRTHDLFVACTRVAQGFPSGSLHCRVQHGTCNIPAIVHCSSLLSPIVAGVVHSYCTKPVNLLTKYGSGPGAELNITQTHNSVMQWVLWLLSQAFIFRAFVHFGNSVVYSASHSRWYIDYCGLWRAFLVNGIGRLFDTVRFTVSLCRRCLGLRHSLRLCSRCLGFRCCCY